MRLLNFFVRCNQLVCRDCLILKHNSHKHDRIEQVAEKDKRELKLLVTKAEKAFEKLQISKTETNQMINQVKKRK